MLKKLFEAIKLRSKFIAIAPAFLLMPLADPTLKLLINDKGEVTPPIERLLNLNQIYVGATSDPDAKLVLKTRSVQEVTSAIQGKTKTEVSWRLKPNQERWEIKSNFTPDQEKVIETICKKDLRLEEEVWPYHKAYMGVLFLGTTLKGVRNRLNYLNRMIDEHHLRFRKLYILTGERNLDERVGETEAELFNTDNGIIPVSPDWTQPDTIPDNERDMMVLVFDQSQHPKIREKKLTMIFAKKRPHKRRAETDDTVEEWLKLNPKSGRYLAISNQPYVLYQQLVINRVLLKSGRNDILVEVIGSGMEATSPSNATMAPGNKAGIYLDNLSKIFYEIVEIKKLMKG